MPVYATKFVLVNKNAKKSSQDSADRNNLVFGEEITVVELQDEAGGYFFEIKQPGNPWNGDKDQCVRFDFEEVQDLFEAINKLKDESERSLK